MIIIIYTTNIIEYLKQTSLNSTKSQHTHYKEFRKIIDNYSIVNKYMAKETPFSMQNINNINAFRAYLSPFPFVIN